MTKKKELIKSSSFLISEIVCLGNGVSLKRPLEDEEFNIIGGKDGTGRETGMVIFKCLSKNGLEFDVRPMGSQEYRTKMYDNLQSYIGKQLTVRFQGLTDDGRPRFPVGVAVRDYE